MQQIALQKVHVAPLLGNAPLWIGGIDRFCQPVDQQGLLEPRVVGWAGDHMLPRPVSDHVFERRNDDIMPGLVVDPTCGSGTTAFVAEQWGRRWITIDTSRVSLPRARARIMEVVPRGAVVGPLQTCPARQDRAGRASFPGGIEERSLSRYSRRRGRNLRR